LSISQRPHVSTIDMLKHAGRSVTVPPARVF
jgi:hypothetical protein